MAKKKIESEQLESQAEAAHEEIVKIEAPALDVEAIKAQARKEAMAELQKELGITPDMIQAQKAQKAKEAQIMEVNLGRQVYRINGVRYTGKVRVSAAQADVLVEMASKKRDRLLNEQFSREFRIEGGLDGGVKAVMVKKELVTE